VESQGEALRLRGGSAALLKDDASLEGTGTCGGPEQRLGFETGRQHRHSTSFVLLSELESETCVVGLESSK
jgi:hypothetical protein